MPATVSQGRRTHILYGDSTGGGHKAGTGRTGKTEFPASWSDDEIIQAIEHIANDPNANTSLKNNGRTVRENRYNGQDVTVVIDTDGLTIITGYPINVPKNP